MMDSYERIFFDSYIKQPNFNNLELILSPHCNLSCRYCYMKRHNKFYDSPVMSFEIIDQSIKLFSHFKVNQHFSINLFGGEPFLQPQHMKYILEKTKTDDQITSIIIPTNGYYSQRIEQFLKTYPKLFISLSVDGIYNENINATTTPFISRRD